MARRILLVALALSLTDWTMRASAAEYATLIFDDGGRVSGTLASPDNTGQTMVAGDLVLAISGGELERFPFQRVAVIDFTGGSPSAYELGALPDRGHMLAMRSGGLRVGHFLNIINGEIVRWQEQGGTTADIPIRQVARVYLDADNARRVFSFAGYGGYAQPRSSSDRYGRYAYGDAQQVLMNELIVPASAAWTDTGLNVTRGDTFRFDSQGQITYIHGPHQAVTAGGDEQMKTDRYPVRWLGVGALIGKVGVSGVPFGIGASSGPITMPASGRLYLGVNDDAFHDNEGNFRVTIMRGR